MQSRSGGPLGSVKAQRCRQSGWREVCPVLPSSSLSPGSHPSAVPPPPAAPSCPCPGGYGSSGTCILRGGLGAQCGVAGEKGGESRDERTLVGLEVSFKGLGPGTVWRWPLGSPPSSAVTSGSRTPPGGSGAFPLCGPGAPGPAPRPLPPGRSLPRGGGGGGVPSAGARGSARSLPFPARQLPTLPALLRGPPGQAAAPAAVRGACRSPVGDGLFPAGSGRAAPTPPQ